MGKEEVDMHSCKNSSYVNYGEETARVYMCKPERGKTEQIMAAVKVHFEKPGNWDGEASWGVWLLTNKFISHQR